MVTSSSAVYHRRAAGERFDQLTRCSYYRLVVLCKIIGMIRYRAEVK